MHGNMQDLDFLALVSAEVNVARKRHPGRDRYHALVGEFGEVAVEAQRLRKGEARLEHLRAELVQLAGTCLRLCIEGDPSLAPQVDDSLEPLPMVEPVAARSFDGLNAYLREHVMRTMPLTRFLAQVAAGRWPGFTVEGIEAWAKKHPTVAHVVLGRGEAPPVFLVPDGLHAVTAPTFRGVFIGHPGFLLSPD